ncbi:hypothetical protein SUGI_0153750 [Cryptomeria japonica]|nr:hypothetical protein SUGI_0153750 [Cryptomeria japonica]
MEEAPHDGGNNLAPQGLNKEEATSNGIKLFKNAIIDTPFLVPDSAKFDSNFISLPISNATQEEKTKPPPEDSACDSQPSMLDRLNSLKEAVKATMPAPPVLDESFKIGEFNGDPSPHFAIAISLSQIHDGKDSHE